MAPPPKAEPQRTRAGSTTKALVAGVFVLTTLVLTTAILFFTASPADDGGTASDTSDADATTSVLGPSTALACEQLVVTVDLSNGDSPTPGDDVILGTSGDDIINALEGDDVVCSLGGNDTVLGGPGNDMLYGGAGNDLLSGNSEDDTIDGEGGNDRLFGGSGNDMITGRFGNDVIGGGSEIDILSGNEGRDTITGGSGNDGLISGGPDNDAVNGGGGDDAVVQGDEGDDTVSGNGGKDVVSGGVGNDVVRGGQNDDTVNGGPGDDFLAGNDGTDTCDGGAGDEVAGDTAGPSCEITAEAVSDSSGPPAIWAFYGNPWTMRSLADVGIEDERVSVRITAKYGGVMTGFRTYYKAAIGSQTAGPGSYSAGTGGLITTTLWPDDGNGFPDESGTPLAEIPAWAPALVNGRPVGSQHDTFFRFSVWETPPTLVAGGVYHVVFENLDPNPNSNFLSINNGYEVNGALERGPFGPQVSDWGILRDTGSWLDWTTRGNRQDGRYDPIFVAEMADGSSWGNGYMEMADQGTALQRYRPVTTTSVVRQMFTPAEDHTVDAVALHVFGDAATMELELSTDDAVLGTWPLEFSASGNDIGQWQTQEFDPITLSEGTTYYLALRMVSGSGTTTISVIRDGSAGGLTTTFPDGATWSDGEAQLSSNGGESWSNFSPADRADLAGLVFREVFS